jgi:NADH dehydrogenase
MILVCGGRGFLGSAIVEELLRRGETVAVLGRDAGKVRARFGDRVAARAGDVREAGSLPAAFAAAEVVINAVQFPTSPIEVPRRGWTFEETDYQGTLNQVAAAQAAGVKRFIYLSGVGAAPGATRHWFRFKYMAEEHIAHSGLQWAVFRPTWVYGPKDNSLNRLLRFGQFLPFIPLFGDGEQAMQPVFVEDVGRVVAESVRSSEAANQLFEIGGPAVMSMNEVLKTALAVMGKKRPILHQPVFLGKALGRVASLLPVPPLSADAIDFITTSAVADNSNLERVFKPRLTPLREGLETYLRK